jgi:hypothetical protein
LRLLRSVAILAARRRILLLSWRAILSLGILSLRLVVGLQDGMD